jgi:PST family polysaccharide transporter
LLIGLFLYPYLIRVLGKEAYGTYIFIFSNIQFFAIFINFGFDFSALKKISLYPNDNRIKSEAVSEVLTAKIYLLCACIAVLGILTSIISFVSNNFLLYIIIFSTLIVDILFPQWYFQGIQKMKFVTYVNLLVRLLTVPFIFIFIKSPNNLLQYTLIVAVSSVCGGIFTFFYLQIKEKIKIRFVHFRTLKSVIKEALPFFLTSLMSVFKQESLTFVIGTFFSMGEVAIYDLANKIVTIIRTFIVSINTALFPKVTQMPTVQLIKKIIRYETLLGLLCILGIALFGYWTVILLGGKNMLPAYPLAIILSASILNNLISGSYIRFVFIQRNRYYFVTKNQFFALITYLFFTATGLYLFENIQSVVAAIALSGFSEIVYCRYLTKKHQLL